MKKLYFIYISIIVIGIIGCSKEAILENQSNPQASLRSATNLTDNTPMKNLAYQLAISDNSIIDPDDGEFLLAKSLISSSPTTNLNIIQAIESNPIITIAFPSLDDFPLESVQEHKANIDYWVYLPQDLSKDTIKAYNSSGTEVNLIQSALDRSKRYCVVKHSEEFYAFLDNEPTSFTGRDRPDSLSTFTSKFTINGVDYYDYIQYHNALAVDNGTPWSLLTGDGGLPPGPGVGPGVRPRGECTCNESNFERDCSPGMDQLGKFRFTNYKDTYKVESFWYGPNLEMRNIFVYYDLNSGDLQHINTGIIKRRSKVSHWCDVYKDLFPWDRSVNGDRTLSQWTEESKGNETKITLGLSPKVMIDGVEVEILKAQIEIKISDKDYNLGNMHVWYEDPYCDHYEYSPVWVGPKGVFKFTHIKG